MLSENVIGLILAVAVTLILILLMISLFSPTFNRGKEGAESYFDSLEDTISEADKYGRSSFFMLGLDDEELEFYLVYFGEAFVFVDDEKDFIRSPRDGSLCVCYWQGERVLCDDCMNLKGSASYDKGGVAPWVVREGEYVNIKKVGGNYEFSRN